MWKIPAAQDRPQFSKLILEHVKFRNVICYGEHMYTNGWFMSMYGETTAIL